MSKKAAIASKPAPKKAAKPASKAAKSPTPKPAGKPHGKPAPSKPAPAKHAPGKPAAAATKSAAKSPAKPVAAKAKDAKHAAAAKAPSAPVPAPAVASPSAAKPATPGPPRPIKRPKAPQVPLKMPPMGKLLDPKNPIRKPLIPSGPKASAMRPLGSHGAGGVEPPKIEGKSPFNKRELERFRTMLVRKRLELVGDVNTMENEALLGQSGSLSNTPSHMAEQGSEAYDQALSLDLAAADRRLIKEIDDALDRIKSGVYGLCQLTGKPIKIDRLEELPWARYSIEAAREMERQAMRS